jgi:hypothetical protein
METFTIVIASLALLVSILSLLKDYIFRAKVDYHFKIISPNCHKTKIVYQFSNGVNTGMQPCYYYRLKGESKNWIAPEKLELMIVKKWYKKGDEFIPDNTFLPMSLNWSHYGKSVLDNIAPKLFKFCDFGSIIHPDYQSSLVNDFGIKLRQGGVALSMDLEVKPFTGTHILTPGIYKFEFALSGKNVSKKTKTFEITFSDYWSDDENDMLNNCLKVEEL